MTKIWKSIDEIPPNYLASLPPEKRPALEKQAKAGLIYFTSEARPDGKLQAAVQYKEGVATLPRKLLEKTIVQTLPPEQREAWKEKLADLSEGDWKTFSMRYRSELAIELQIKAEDFSKHGASQTPGSDQDGKIVLTALTSAWSAHLEDRAQPEPLQVVIDGLQNPFYSLGIYAGSNPAFSGGKL